MIQKKIKSREELSKICDQIRKEKKTIGFTSGAFDILHAGHVDYLEKAKGICDVLIVGVNSDRSVKRYKGSDRPIIKEKQRLKVVASLESVNFVFLFHERRNKNNIMVIKPDYYIKAEDYKPEELTSKEIVENYGGVIRLIPVLEAISTTDIIRKAISSKNDVRECFIEKNKTVYIERLPRKTRPAVFFDRDGTINEEIAYLHEAEKFKLLPNALEGIKKFQEMGYKIVIVTNQPGIGMGYYSKEDFFRVNITMLRAFSDAGILVDKIYFCPHSKAEKCDCRKPQQALIRRAKDELNLDLSRSIMIGDKTSDIETGKRAGMKSILVQTGFRGEDGMYSSEPDYWADDLLDATNIVLCNDGP